MRYNGLIGWRNVEVFSVTLAGCAVVESVYRSRWKSYECLYLLLVLTLFILNSYSGLYLRGGADDIRQIFTLAISRLAVLAAVQFLLHADQGVAPVNFVGSLRFDQMGEGGGVLFRLLLSKLDSTRFFDFLMIAERMPMNPVLVALAVP